MNDLVIKDNELIDKKRKELKLPAPNEFKDGKLTLELIEKLTTLVEVNFNKDAIEINNFNGYESIGVDIRLQNNRINNIFGLTHIRKEYEIIENKSSTYIKQTDEGEKEIEIFKVAVNCTFKIGNLVEWEDKNTGEKSSTFVTLFECTGYGYNSHVNKNTAFKTAQTYALKSCYSELGMLKHIHISETENTVDKASKTNDKKNIYEVVLTEKVKTLKGKIAAIIPIKIVDTGIECNGIIYANNYDALDILNQYEEFLTTGAKLKINGYLNKYEGVDQLIINKIIL